MYLSDITIRSSKKSKIHHIANIEYSEFDKGRIIGYFEPDMKWAEISQSISISIHTIIGKWQKTDSMGNTLHCSAPRIMPETEYQGFTDKLYTQPNILLSRAFSQVRISQFSRPQEDSQIYRRTRL
jgi:hypothetical protein